MEDQAIVSINGFVKSTQGKWLQIKNLHVFYVEGRKIIVDDLEGHSFTLTDNFPSATVAQDFLDEWVSEDPWDRHVCVY